MKEDKKMWYPLVEEFLKKDLECFVTMKEVGSAYVGKPDVLGARDIGGRWSGEVELIAVEVKPNRNSFGKILGQALGYSLLAHKCYLAVYLDDDEEFSQEEKEMANRLGVGLINIGERCCKEILSSQHHAPIETLFLNIIDTMGYNRCNFCGTFFQFKKYTAKSPKKAVEMKREFLYSAPMMDVSRKRKLLFTGRRDMDKLKLLVCPECIKALHLHKIE